MRSRIARASASAGAIAAMLCVVPLAHSATTRSPLGPPSASTGGVGEVRGTSATLQGAVNPHGLATTYVFQYGPSTAYGSQTTPVSIGAGETTVKVSQTVASFPVGSHYRILATNSDGARAGHDRSYTIAKTKLKFAMADPKELPPTPYGGTFVLRGTLTGAGGALQPIVPQSSGFPYLTAFTDIGAATSTNAAGAFAISVADLTKSTQLRVRTTAARPLTSPIVTARVAPRVTLKVRTSAHRGLVRLYGTVTPAEVGASVLFQLEAPSRPRGKAEREVRFSTQARSVVRRATHSYSRFSQVFTVRKGGRYRAYVLVRPGALVSGASSGVTLHADPNLAKRK